MAEAATSPSSGGSGLDPKVAGLLAWIFAPLGSVIFLVVDKDDEFVKFHAMQSLIASIVGWVIYFVGTAVTLGIGSICFWIIPMGIQIFGAIKAYQGEKYKFPIIGDMADK
jgi:uncharacterized membrane protein